MNKQQKTFFDILILCLRSKCPVCVEGMLFSPIFEISSLGEIFLPLKCCPRCKFKFKREPGYYFGVLTPTLSILSLMSGVIFVIFYYLIFKPQDMNELLPALAVGMCFGMVALVRPSIAIFVSIDHSVCPPSIQETEGRSLNEKTNN